MTDDTTADTAATATTTDAAGPGVITAIARLQARPGLEAEVRAQALSLVAPTRAEAGNVSYRAYEDPTAPGAWVVLEEWADAASWEAHLASPHLTEALSRTAALLAGAPVLRVFPPALPS
ncbi:putative quinol monooxygenase [Streptomyces sp. NBC_01244]|uniref:putative quinol monooxygenase n=1 Tax=Streptomyces sp. NBC_01244 TaxID=2903797 RepID=UPI002E16440F|nr:antibiotic biosynthesis monooxygenase [Streptomyces sp. NBC_01244]